MEEQKKNLKSTVLRLYYSGKTVAEISKKTGISKSTAYYWINNIREEEKGPVNLKEFHILQQKCKRLETIIRILKATPCSAKSDLSYRLKTIEELVSDEYSVNILCEAFDVTRGTYYNHIFRGKRGQTQLVKRRQELFPVIEEIYHESNQIYGAGKIAAVLKERGIVVTEGFVASVMHEHGLFSIRGGAKTLYYLNQARKNNIIKQNFKVSRPNEVWVSDVTYFALNHQTYYICVIIDLFARKVVAWKLGDRNSTNLTKATLRMAYVTREPTASLIFHSDNGSNYISDCFRKYTKQLNIVQSFSRSHNPYDNSVCESFFSNMKQEELYRKDYKSKAELIRSINEYMCFYNEKRPHSIIRYQTPNKFEATYYERQKDKKIKK